VFWIRIRKVCGLPNPDPSVFVLKINVADPDPNPWGETEVFCPPGSGSETTNQRGMGPDPSIIKQNSKKIAGSLSSITKTV
jgi:hypothetical protein